jgi:hypothetical protein
LGGTDNIAGSGADARYAGLAVLLVILITGIAFLLKSPPEAPFPGTLDRSEFFWGHRAWVDERISFVRAGDWGMGRTIEENDVIMWAQADPENLSVGDIIYFENPLEPGQLLARRIAEIEEGTFRTKGDGGADLDPFVVTSEELRGVVIGVIYYREP